METLRTVAQVRDRVRRVRADGGRVGLVPTMGALHEGHLSLVRMARRDCDLVVVSLFVNPAQFGEESDLASYPRTEARDAELAAGAGADLLFAPAVAEVYPDGFATTVRVTGVTEHWEGEHRGAAHFDGVATVVAKLFAMVAPDLAYFGQKDAQQVAVVRRMVTDLNLPVEIRVGPTVREPDGLAMSSRNVRLRPEDRERALSLRAGLDAVQATIRDGADGADGADGLDSAVRAGVEAMRSRGVEPEYLALVDPETFAPVVDLSGPALAVVAARVGDVRLIDNLPVEASA